MQKIIATYNGEDVFINELHIEDTFKGIVCGLTERGKRIVEEDIPRHCKKNFYDTPIYIAGKNSLDYSKHLPNNIVYARLMTCCPYCGDSMILVWFQDDNMDFFEEAKKHFKEVDWEKESQRHDF